MNADRSPAARPLVALFAAAALLAFAVAARGACGHGDRPSGEATIRAAGKASTDAGHL